MKILSLSEKIKAIEAVKDGEKQIEVAQRLGISPYALNAWCHGRSLGASRNVTHRTNQARLADALLKARAMEKAQKAGKA